jgi:hypothetical protein
MAELCNELYAVVIHAATDCVLTCESVYWLFDMCDCSGHMDLPYIRHEH